MKKCASSLPSQLRDESVCEVHPEEKRKVIKPILKKTSSKESSDADRLDSNPFSLAE